MNRLFDVTEADKVLAVSDLGFDLSVYDIFGLLAAGGTVVLPEPTSARDPDHWRALLDRHHVTIWNSVPQLMNMLVDTATASAEGPPPLRLVLLSGDWIPVRLPDRIRTRWPAAAVVSLGGATEGSIWSIYYPIGNVDPSWESIPYGKALPNQRMYVLNERLQLCPEGVSGDIYIGGIGVALGYWRNDVLTRAQFSRDPRSGERLYKTGDRGRFIADGNIEFRGRNDKQVKIRGFRIELGEIEVQLSRHPSIKDAAVIVREDVRGDRRLVAYFTQSGDEGPSAEELRTYLKDRLPDYMVPSAFVRLESLPLTPNGKLERKALPAPEAGAYVAQVYEAPAGRIEELLALIWQEVLSVERVSRRDNLFELGGHSLLIMQMNERLHRAGLDVDVRAWFSSSSLAELATAVRERNDAITVPPNLIPDRRMQERADVAEVAI
jgi:acyl-coenzyme A synthetase/AMP-(fatty) acid ligase